MRNLETMRGAREGASRRFRADVPPLRVRASRVLGFQSPWGRGRGPGDSLVCARVRVLCVEPRVSPFCVLCCRLRLGCSCKVAATAPRSPPPPPQLGSDAAPRSSPRAGALCPVALALVLVGGGLGAEISIGRCLARMAPPSPRPGSCPWCCRRCPAADLRSFACAARCAGTEDAASQSGRPWCACRPSGGGCGGGEAALPGARGSWGLP